MTGLMLEAAALDAMFAAAPWGLTLLDAQLRYVRVNDRLAELNGIPADDHIGKRPAEVIPAVGPAVESVLRHVIHTKLPMVRVKVDLPAPAAPTSEASSQISLFPLVTDGAVIGVLGVVE